MRTFRTILPNSPVLPNLPNSPLLPKTLIKFCQISHFRHYMASFAKFTIFATFTKSLGKILSNSPFSRLRAFLDISDSTTYKGPFSLLGVGAGILIPIVLENEYSEKFILFPKLRTENITLGKHDFSSALFPRYCQIRCIALGVLQTPEGFWIFLFRHSSEWGRGYANHNTTRSQTASPACDSYETGERNLRTDTI